MFLMIVCTRGEEEEEGVGGTHEEKEGATQRNILFLCFVFMQAECFENADMTILTS